MAKLFASVLLLVIVSLSCGGGNASVSRPHFTNLIVGGGPAGLYTAWRLSSARSKNETTAIFEWSPERLGGRVLTKTFGGGQFLELGAMRFTDGHMVLNQVLQELNLTDFVTEFPMSGNRLYYVRGLHMYQEEIPKKGMPYWTPRRRMRPESLFDEIYKKMHPSNETSRASWCKFFDEGVFPANVTSKGFKANDNLGNTGYWNLLLDQLGGEDLAYAADAGGYTSTILNSNAAYTMLLNGHFGNKYLRLKTGFSKLMQVLEDESLKKSVKINKGQRLTEFYWNAQARKFYSTFMSYDKHGKSTGELMQVSSDRLFLCSPKRSLEKIKETEVVGNNWPANKERRVLKHSLGEFYMQSVIPSPAYKVGLIYDKPWWFNTTFKPSLIDQNIEPTNVTYSRNYGPTVTDLPIRNVYYFGNNNKTGGGKPKYGILASYDDMKDTFFWAELELSTNESLRAEHPSFVQPLFSGAKITDLMQHIIRVQLNQVHYNETTNLRVPPAEEGYFMNWGREPFGAGYHTWKAHYKIAEAMYYITRPSEAIGVEVPVYVSGETYSYDQRWIEGAFTTAETVLVDKIGLKPLLNKSPAEYPLICRPTGKK